MSRTEPSWIESLMSQLRHVAQQWVQPFGLTRNYATGILNRNTELLLTTALYSALQRPA